MSGLVYACIAPHGGMVLPTIGDPDAGKALATRAAMEELGRRLAAYRPETIALITPHGTAVGRAFSLLDSARVAGEVGGPRGAAAVEFRVDRELNAAIAAVAREAGDGDPSGDSPQRPVPVARLVRGVPGDPTSCLPLDWGAVIPLWFLGHGWTPSPRVSIACPDGRIPWEDYPRFGAAIRRAAERVGRRVALVASADLGHAHDPDGPYGYDPASAEYDRATVEAIRAQDLGRLLHFDRAWVERARPDALWQMLNLHGAIEGQGFVGKLLSYEVPTYFGMLCASYERGT